MIKHTEEQLKFINHNYEDSIILNATAGSGKTQSAISRLDKMIADGIDPNEIIFFSFSNVAVNELRKRCKHNIKITTIHSFCYKILYDFQINKEIFNMRKFISYFFNNKKNLIRNRMDLSKATALLKDDTVAFFTDIDRYKLLTFENENKLLKKPLGYDMYINYLKENNLYDFSDLIFEVYKLSNKKENFNYFNNMYKYIIIDEYQDTSVVQLKLLLNLNAQQYCLVGDKNQAIFAFSGVNCDALERILKQHKNVKLMGLTINFRSTADIVENANKYTTLKAKSKDNTQGIIHKEILSESDIIKKMNEDKEYVILVRDNRTIKALEYQMLINKTPICYINYFTKDELETLSQNKGIKKNIMELIPIYKTYKGIADWIKENSNQKKFITTIHKSKGKEYENSIIVNSLPPDLPNIPGYMEKRVINMDNPEHTNVHYVAVTRSKKELFYGFID